MYLTYTPKSYKWISIIGVKKKREIMVPNFINKAIVFENQEIIYIDNCGIRYIMRDGEFQELPI